MSKENDVLEGYDYDSEAVERMVRHIVYRRNLLSLAILVAASAALMYWDGYFERGASSTLVILGSVTALLAGAFWAYSRSEIKKELKLLEDRAQSE